MGQRARLALKLRSFQFKKKNPRRRVTRRRTSAAKLIPAKLKRMPNGRYKVFVSPGTMVKMRMNPEVRWSGRRGTGAYAHYRIVDDEYTHGYYHVAWKGRGKGWQYFGVTYGTMEQAKAAAEDFDRSNATFGL